MCLPVVGHTSRDWSELGESSWRLYVVLEALFTLYTPDYSCSWYIEVLGS